MSRPPGLSVRLKLTLSYAGFLILAGALMLAVVWFFLVRDLPGLAFTRAGPPISIRSAVLDSYLPATALALAGLLAVGLLGGWILAGRMLAPLARINAATELAARGSLSHRI